MYTWVEHVGELELAIEAPTDAAVFADALAAFAELTGDGGGPGGERRDVELHAGDRASLLAEWLEELVYLADAQQFVPERLTDLRLEDGRLRAGVHGHTGNPTPLVKAVTRHRLLFEPAEDGWHATVVLDV